jgi:energy-converting hydrogenase B subunit D
MMSGYDLAFDIVLAALLVLLACGTLMARELFSAAILFIAFGLLMALVWARLDAPDLALAEAVIGAGLTGVLLVQVVRAMSRRDAHADDTSGMP